MFRKYNGFVSFFINLNLYKHSLAIVILTKDGHMCVMKWLEAVVKMSIKNYRLCQIARDTL